jgi:formylglycine-generating enzyme required for sulfatase activity/uncharacterized caspase-like protein
MSDPTGLRSWRHEVTRHRNYLVFALFLSSAHISAGGERYALVIGIDGYRALDKLTSCVADAEAVAKVLEESGGFSTVIRLTDRAAEADRPTLATVRRRIEHVAKAAEKGDTVLLFFSGHGVERGGAGYLVPIDGDFDNAVPLAWVNEQLEKSAATTKVAIFDCCHAGAKGVPGIRPSLTSAVMLLSCSKGELSHNDESSGHGVFTRYLIEGLRGAADGADESAKDSQVTVSELYRYVRKHVVDWSLAQGKKQTPLCLPEEGSGVALVRLKSIEELQKEREALKRSLDAMQEAGRDEVVKALREEIARLEARLAALGKTGGDPTAALAQFRDLKGLLDNTLQTHRPTSSAVQRVRSQLSLAAKRVVDMTLPPLQSKRSAYDQLSRDLLPTAPRATQLENEIKTLQAIHDEVFWSALPHLWKEATFKVYTGWPCRAQEAKERQQETARALSIEVEHDFDLGHGAKITVVLIPAGEFMMGVSETEEEALRNSGMRWREHGFPRHRVTISKPFWIGKYEVTVAKFLAFVRDTGYRTDAEKGGRPWGWKDGGWWRHEGLDWQTAMPGQTDAHPVMCVSWNDAKAFCDWASGQTGGHFSLPTEAQWEYACRAGSEKRFSFGDEDALLQVYAWYSENSDCKTHAVGQKRPNAWGLYDMHGNVEEWCADWYDEAYYDKSAPVDPPGPTDGRARVSRGGSWYRAAVHARSSDRYLPSEPSETTTFQGFRVVFVPRAAQ